MLAVDPSSKRSGGALLGDRARIVVDPRDDEVFIRSMAAGGRLGGLAPATRAAAHALAAAFDVVVVETVGVGQSETEVAEVADTVAVVVQPGGGDVLQFLKSGIMEIPDVLVVTKADLGPIALRSRRDLSAALRSLGVKDTKVVAVSSLSPPAGFDELVDALDEHARGSTSGAAAGRAPRRRAGGLRRRARRSRAARARRPARGAQAARRAGPGARRPRAHARARGAGGGMSDSRRRLLVDLALMIGGVRRRGADRQAAGAPNLGTAMTFGQIGFALAAFYVLARR